MNNKIILAVVGILLVVGAVVLLSNRSSQQGAPTQQNTQAQPTTAEVTTAPTTSPTGEETIKKNVVTETSSGFNPQTITIKAGETVTWMNNSGDTGNVSSAVHPTHLVYPQLNLGNIANGESKELTFSKAGTYKYHDHLNPTRFGTVVVE